MRFCGLGRTPTSPAPASPPPLSPPSTSPYLAPLTPTSTPPLSPPSTSFHPSIHPTSPTPTSPPPLSPPSTSPYLASLTPTSPLLNRFCFCKNNKRTIINYLTTSLPHPLNNQKFMTYSFPYIRIRAILINRTQHPHRSPRLFTLLTTTRPLHNCPLYGYE
jgi:hypothetical protein